MVAFLMSTEEIRGGSKQSGTSFDLHLSLSKTLPAESGIKVVGQKTRFFKNKAEKLLKTKGKTTWIAKNKPENKAEKLLKTRSSEKNKPEQS